MDDQTEDEWIEDFCAPALTQEDLEELLVLARQTNNANLRRLVGHFASLRNAIGWLLVRIEATEGREVTKNDEQLKLVRHLVGMKEV